jgi:hypothetical protein
MNRSRIAAAAVLTTVLGLMAVAPSAGASFHEIKIRSIFRSPSATGAFMELQMYADGQNLVGGHQLRICNATASLCSTYALSGNVANGQNQRRILIGGTTAPGSPDFTLPIGTDLNGVASGGAACWDTVDCVSWGTFTADASLPSPAGTPIAGGLSTTQVSLRNTARGCATALDLADDTNNSAADFGTAVGYQVRNNSLAPTETLCPSAPATKAKKCKKKKGKKHSADAAKKKKCKKKKKK